MNGLVFALIFVPVLAFLLVVLPMWLTLYYRDRNRQSHALSSEEWQEIRRTLELSDKLDQRIATLEAILDRDNKGWRNEP